MRQFADTKIHQLQIDKILPNPNQPRKHFDQTSLDELADSIKAYGLISPIQVRQVSEELYELVAGERRLRASKLAGKKMIPSIIVEISDEDSAVLAIMENIQRENLSYFEEARSYAQLMAYYGLTQEQIAAVLGKSQSFVANKIRLLKLEPEVAERLTETGLSERHARALLRLPDAELQNEVLEKVVKRDMSVKKTEELVENVRQNVLTNNYTEKITPKTKARVKSYINAQVYVNTIKSAFKMVKDSRKEAEYAENEKQDYIEIQIRIPK